MTVAIVIVGAALLLALTGTVALFVMLRSLQKKFEIYKTEQTKILSSNYKEFLGSLDKRIDAEKQLLLKHSAAYDALRAELTSMIKPSGASASELAEALNKFLRGA